MFSPASLVSISLGWVVLDRPDQSGLYIAKDMVGGWAYAIADEDDDTRFRGQGSCAGGVDVALRCALLSAAACVPECTRMHIMVDTRRAHRVVVGLALHDRRVNAAIGGRPISVMTRPLDRSAVRVAAAAERAASITLRDRELAERQAAVSNKTKTDVGEAAEAGQENRCLGAWRERRTAGWDSDPMRPGAFPIMTQTEADASMTQAEAGASVHQPLAVRVVRPFMSRMRNAADDKGFVSASSGQQRSNPLGSWLRDIDSRVKSLRTDLQGVGA